MIATNLVAASYYCIVSSFGPLLVQVVAFVYIYVEAHFDAYLTTMKIT